MNDFKKEYRTIMPNEYHLFKEIDANREVKTSKFGELTKNRQILSDSLSQESQYSDVICCWKTQDEVSKLLILDGQHRKFCLCKEQKPVDTKILSNQDGSELNTEQIDRAVRILNNSGFPWKNPQYMKWGNEFNKDPFIEQFLKFNNEYKYIDINVLGVIVTGDPRYNNRSQLSSRTLKFDLGEQNLILLNYELNRINECTKSLLSIKRKNKERGLKKVTVNNMLITFFRYGHVSSLDIQYIFETYHSKFIVDDSRSLLIVLTKYLNK
jgi:hypothetical protein